MRYPTPPDELRRRRLIVAGVGTALLLIAFVTYAVLVHRSHEANLAATTTVPVPGTAKPVEAKPTPVPTMLAALQPTDDPERFAREVAGAIFSWDTATMIGRDDHIEQLVKVGDPTGESTAGLLSDLEGYLPTDDTWLDLAQYETKQWLTIDSIATPSQWPEAEAQAGGALLPGTTAFTIHGVRHRTGIWESAPVATEHDLAFTIFIVCGPSYPECHLLRLSILDKPLD